MHFISIQAGTDFGLRACRSYGNPLTVAESANHSFFFIQRPIIISGNIRIDGNLYIGKVVNDLILMFHIDDQSIQIHDFCIRLRKRMDPLHKQIVRRSAFVPDKCNQLRIQLEKTEKVFRQFFQFHLCNVKGNRLFSA